MTAFKKIFFFILLLTVQIICNETNRDQLLLEALDSLMNENFDFAINQFDKLSNEIPDDPCPVFFKGMCYWRKSFNMRDYQKFDPYCIKNWRETIKICEKRLKKNPQDHRALFFKGGAYGYIGINHIRQGNFFSAAKYGYSGVKSAMEAFEKDSSNWDAYYGLGLYHVNAANSSKVIQWIQKILPIPNGDEDLGIEYLKLAEKNGVYSKFLASPFLGFVYNYYRADYDSAYYFVKPFLEKYPNSTDIIIITINILFNQGMQEGETDWRMLLKLLQQLDRVMENREEQLIEWLVEKYQFMKGYIYFKLGDYKNSIYEIEQFLNMNPENEFCGVAYYILARIEEMENSDSKKIINLIQRAEKSKQIGNLDEIISDYLKQESHDKSLMEFFGIFFDMPDKI